MKSRRVLRYNCDHCSKGFWEKRKCRTHELHCLRNPDRVCGKCKERGLTQHPLSYYLDDDTESWYGDIDTLRRLAQGCPLCMLAAKMAVDKDMWDEEKWTDFDYDEEVKRFELEKFPDGIPSDGRQMDNFMDRVLPSILRWLLVAALTCNMVTCCGPYRVVKSDEGTFYVPSDAIPFGSFHIYKGPKSWWLWLDSSDRVTTVHNARIVGNTYSKPQGQF